MKKIGFIGAGNMGGALIEAVCKKIGGENVIICDSLPEKTARFAEKYGCEVSDASDVTSAADYLFICVKPQTAEKAMAEIKPVLDRRTVKPVLVSIMAGVTITRVRDMAGGQSSSAMPIIRIMPNVAAAVGAGVILCDSDGASDGQVEEFRSFMSLAGEIDMLPEKLIDAGSAVSGCGPAFVCMFIEAMADGAVKCGIPRQKALSYAVETVLGTAELLKQTGKHPAVVKDEVTSPAGTTIEGVQALEEGGMRASVIKAVCAAYEKNKKL